MYLGNVSLYESDFYRTEGNVVLDMNASKAGNYLDLYWRPVTGPVKGGTLSAVGPLGTMPEPKVESVENGNIWYYRFDGKIDGAAQVGKLGTDINFDWDESFSIEAWVRVLYPPVSERGYIFGNKWVHGFHSGYGLRVRQQEPGHYRFEFEFRDRHEPDTHIYIVSSGDQDYNASVWRHIVVANFDAVDDDEEVMVRNIYVDGELSGQSRTPKITYQNPDFCSPVESASIGSAVYGSREPDQPFTGDIAVVRVYDYPLTGAEVFNTYKSGFASDVVWQCRGTPLDLTGDCVVDFKDFEVLIDYWLDDERIYAN